MSFKRSIKDTWWYKIYARSKMEYYESAKDFIRTHYDIESVDEKRIEKSMKRCFMYGGVHYSEYWKMRFDELSFREKLRFVPRIAEMNLYWQVNPKRKYGPLLENKGKCYDLFGNYYNRDLVCVLKSDIIQGLAKEKVLSFIGKHNRFIVKPLNGACGRGVRIFDSSIDYNELVSSYSRGFVMEELINQNEKMANLHPNSVNTVRIITVNYGDEIEVKWPFLRVGRGDSIVDNAGQGGVFMAIDVRSGLTFAAGDESRHAYVVHPDTNVSLIGFQIPQWNKLCEIVKEMARICPDCHIMGWDMAFSDQGWVVVECNYGPNLVYQYITRGVAKEFKKVQKKLHAKKLKIIALKTLKE